MTLDRLAAQGGVRRGAADLRLGLAGLARPGADESACQVGDVAVLEPQLGLEAELELLGLVEDHAVLVEGQVGRDEVAQLGPALELRHELGVPFEERLHLGLDVGVADLLDRALDGQGLVGGQGEVGLNLDVHLEGHRAVLGQLDGLDVELGLGDRVELVVLVELLQAGHQQGRLDLAGDLLAEAALDERLRRPAGAEARHLGLLAHRAERLVELALDLGLGDVDLDVLLARAGVGDLDVQFELVLFGFGPLGRAALGLVGHGLGGGVGVAFVFPGAHRRHSFVGLGPSTVVAGAATRTGRARANAASQPGLAIHESGRWDLNPRQPRWQRGALPLSYSRFFRLKNRSPGRRDSKSSIERRPTRLEQRSV